ncbi:MAG: hypothetical protein KAS32_10240 [Candidatus Peribacteraceae bacterium]|nr:hypothetical protein [Candidatus Peribacteraceae bacterium]
MTDNKEPYNISRYKLGEFVTNISTLEFMLEWLIQCLMDTDSQTRKIVLVDMRFYDKIRLLERLYHKNPNYEKKHVDSLVSKLDDIKQRRNKLLHSLWTVDIGREYTIEYYKRKNESITLKTEQITEQYLDELIHDISFTLRLVSEHTKLNNKGVPF